MAKLLKYIYRICVLAGIATTFVSCEPGSTPNAKEEGGSAIIRLVVKTDEQMNVDTRAVSEDQIHDMHVLVYDNEGNLIGQKYQTGSTSVNVTTQRANGCTIYVIANTNKPDLFKGYDIHKVGYLKGMIHTISAWNELTGGDYLPMTGSMENVDITAGGRTLSMEVKRMVARIKLSIEGKSGNTVFINNYSIHDLPTKSYYILRPTTTEADEKDTGNALAGEDASTDWISSDNITVNSSNVATTTFYMFENRRGVNNSITVHTEKAEENAPAHATYININGSINGINANWKVYLGADDTSNFNIKRNCSYSYIISINGINDVDARVIVEPESTDLSKEGTANCYLASASNQWYSFDATVRGNGETQDYVAEQYSTVSPGISMMPTQLTSSIDATHIPMNTIKDAVVVWETSQKLIEYVRWDRGSKRVKFKTGTAIGNALIAVRDASQKILWSWHIWRTDGVNLNALNPKHAMTITTNTDRQWYANILGKEYAKRRRTLTILRCNLGARLDDGCNYNTPEGNIGIYNMQYQFGRKDPFPGSVTYDSSEETVIYGYGSSNTYQDAGFKIGDNAIDSYSLAGLNAKSTLDYVIQHPDHFIYGVGAGLSSWFYNATGESPELKINRCLWGDNNTSTMSVNDGGLDPDPWGTPGESGRKTIYDPCPAGWRVSAADSWTGVGKDDMGASWIGLSNTQIYQGGFDRGFTLFFGSSSGTSTFCPATGRRFQNGKEFESIGGLGGLWWSSPGITQGTYFFSISSTIHLASDMPTAFGMPVRCTKIE